MGAKYRCISLMICLFLFMQGLQSYALNGMSLIDFYDDTQIYYISESPDRVRRTIESFGLEAKVLSRADFDKDLYSIKHILLQGETLNLAQKEIIALQTFVSKGGNLSIVGPVSIAQAFGFEFGNEIEVKGVIESMNGELEVNWPAPVYYQPVLPEDTLDIYTLFKENKGIAAAGRTYGLGKVYYTADVFYSFDAQEIVLFPYIMNNMTEFLDIKPIKRIDDVRVYMDWGFNYAADPKEIVDLLSDGGVSEVHLSAWYDIGRVRNFYEEFIKLCHTKGILVYAWFELPMVTQEFWNDNDAVRQKNIYGEDAVVGWRSLVALEDPLVNDKVKQEVASIVEAFNWDGLNLAELYFEPAGGFSLVGDITPFSEYFVNDFIEKYGFNPAEIFVAESNLTYTQQLELMDAYISERINLITKLNVDYVYYFESNYPELDLYITLIDDSLDAEITKHIGSDSRQIMSALESTDVKLQIEDPFHLWSNASGRYLNIGKYFSDLYPENFESIDINIVNRASAFPTSKQTGTEYNYLVFHGAAYSQNVHLYAFNTVYALDFMQSPYVLGAYVSIRKFEDSLLLESPAAFIIEGDFKGNDVYRNKEIWPFRNDHEIMLPKGYSLLSTSEMEQSGKRTPWITNITAEVLGHRILENGIEIEYYNRQGGYLSTDMATEEIFIDGQKAILDRYVEEETYTISLPKGSHIITLVWKQEN